MNNGNGNVNNRKDEDMYWYPEEVIPHIIRYLKEKFPDSIIRQESNNVDIMVLREIDSIPVEIQRTYSDRKYNTPAISKFEDLTRRQVEQNIDISNVCWLFLDSKFLRYLQNVSNKQISLNMTWLYQHYKEKKVKVFSITLNGIIKELEDEDLNILTKFTMNELEKNRSKIEYNVLKWKGFTTEELNDIYNLYTSEKKENIHFSRWLMRKESTYREKEYQKILESLANVYDISNVLNCTVSQDVKKSQQAVKVIYGIGLFKRSGGCTSDKYAKIQFVDESNVAKYFDGYNSNKELWKYIRIHPIDTKTFYAIIRGKYPNFIKDRNGQKTLEDTWV